MDTTNFSLMLAQDVAKLMLKKHVGRLTVGDDEAPEQLTRLADQLEKDSSGVETWVFTDRDLGLDLHTLSIHSYPWGPAEAMLTKAAPEPEHEHVNAAITNLRGLKF